MIDSACRPSHQVILYIGGRRLLNDICGYGGIGRRAGFRSCHLSDGILGRYARGRPMRSWWQEHLLSVDLSISIGRGREFFFDCDCSALKNSAGQMTYMRL